MTFKKIAIILFAGCVTCACCSSDALPETNIPASAVEHPAPANPARRERGNTKIEAEMHALVAGNPLADAGRALRAGDKRLWAYHNRNGQVIPGMENMPLPENQEVAVKMAPGMGDMIYGRTHQELRKQLLDYMQQYNRYILESH